MKKVNKRIQYVIAIDASRANRKEKTGVEWYAYHIILHLVEIIPQDISVILYFQDEPDDVFKNLPKNVSCKVLKWPPRYLWTHLRLSWQCFVDKPHVLFIPAHVAPFFFMHKSILMLHDVAFKQFKHIYSLKERFYQNIIAILSLVFCKKIIVPSEFTKNEVLKYYPFAKKDNIKVVHHGFVKRKYDFNEKEVDKILNKYGIRQDEYLLYTGRIEKKKNIHTMIKAFDLLKKNPAYNLLKFVLVGKPGYGYDEIKPLIDEKSDIIELGWVEEDNLQILRENAKICMYITLYEGFGLPILEGFAHKKVVITSKGGVYNEVGSDAAYYTDPDDVTCITKDLDIILQDKELQEKLIQRGEHRLKNFTWEKAAEKTAQELLNEIT